MWFSPHHLWRTAIAIDLTVTYTITAPASTDGRGEVAVLNDSSSANFVGYLLDSSGFDSPEVRESSDEIVEGDGGVHGSFYHGRRPFTLDILLKPAATWALSNARMDKLFRATNAMRSDGTVVWTETGGVAKRLSFRRQQPLRFSDRRALFAAVSADARILSNATPTPTAPGAGLTNAGNAGTLPSFTFTAPASGTVVLSRTSPSPTESLTLTVGGASGLTASTATVVDFAARTVTQGGVSKLGAVSYPSSVWWEMHPGANTIAMTGAGGTPLVSWRSAWI